MARDAMNKRWTQSFMTFIYWWRSFKVFQLSFLLPHFLVILEQTATRDEEIMWSIQSLRASSSSSNKYWHYIRTLKFYSHFFMCYLPLLPFHFVMSWRGVFCEYCFCVPRFRRHCSSFAFWMIWENVIFSFSFLSKLPLLFSTLD